MNHRYFNTLINSQTDKEVLKSLIVVSTRSKIYDHYELDFSNKRIDSLTFLLEFIDTQKIVGLTMKFSLLKYYPNILHSHFCNLVRIDLSNNQIRKITIDVSLSKLEEFNASNNMLETFECEELKGLKLLVI